MNSNFNFSNLSQHPKLFPELTKLANNCFGYQIDNEFKTDFYPLLDQKNWQDNHIILDKNDKVVGHIGARKKNLLINEQNIPIHILGGFCIHPDLRKQGLFNNFLQAIIKKYEDETSLFMLWSDRLEYFQKLGFSYAMSYKESMPSLKNKLIFDDRFHVIETKYNLINEADQKAMQGLYKNFINKNFHSIDRTPEDWQNIKKITSSDLYLVKKDQTTLAYFFKNKGMDLPNIVHEFAYDKSIKEEFVFYLKNNHITWYPERFKDMSEKTDDLKYLALIKKGSNLKFKEFVNALTKSSLDITEITDSQISFKHDQVDYSFDLSDFLPLLMGPNPAEEFDETFKGFYISGLDSL